MYMNNKEVKLTIKLSKELHDRFKTAVKAKDNSMSRVLRSLMRKYIADGG